MKKIFVTLISLILTFSLVSCKNNDNFSNANSKLVALNSVSYSANNFNEKFEDEEFLQKLSNFSNYIYELTSEEKNNNYAVSPLSIYMALSVLHNIGDENVKNEIESLFSMTAEDIEKTSKLFLSLITEMANDDLIITKLDLTNSIWFDTKCEPDKTALQELAEKLFCHAFKTSFSENIKQANDDIRNFIKSKTNGLIDSDFDLSQDTVFAIINTLYFKDIWNYDKILSKEQRNFYIDENAVMKEFLIGHYESGEVAETECSYYFYITTHAGYKLKFIVPKDGYSLNDAMSLKNLNEVNAKKAFYDDNDKFDHYTRCIFPKFKISSDTNLKEVFEKNGLLQNAFSCYKTNLLEENLKVSDIKHKVVFDVNEKGIEGAAVTIIENKAMSILPEKPKAYHDFVIDKNFGFILTTTSNIVLFEGQVTNP